MRLRRVSRRSFVKTALGGTAAALLPRIGFPAGSAVADTRAAAKESDLSRVSLAEASALVRSKKISPVELTQTCLKRIEQLDGKFNAFITITGESAVTEARKAEAENQQGRRRGPLHGKPISLKDL